MMGLLARLREPLVIQFAVPVPVAELLQRAADEREEAAVAIEKLEDLLWRARDDASISPDTWYAEASAILFASAGEAGTATDSEAGVAEGEHATREAGDAQ